MPNDSDGVTGGGESGMAQSDGPGTGVHSGKGRHGWNPGRSIHGAGVQPFANNAQPASQSHRSSGPPAGSGGQQGGRRSSDPK